MNHKYNDIIIPEELEEMINKTIKKSNKQFLAIVSAIAATFIIFTSSLNLSPTFAESLMDIPILSQVVSVLTFTKSSEEIESNVTYIQVDTSSDVDDYINQVIQDKVEMVLQEAQINAAEYKEAYISTGGTEAQYKEKNMSVTVDYEIYQHNDNYISFRVYSHESLAAVYASNLYFTLDLKNKLIVDLETILGHDYIDIITKSVLEQINEDARNNPDKYFDDYKADDFKVREDIDFYLNSDNQLVLVFNKYELAAGAYGRLEFIIPVQ